MKLTFFLITIFINCFNPLFLKSQENISSKKNLIKNTPQEKLFNNDKSTIEKIHIVNVGDTISSISKLYSINKNLIIKLNDLKDEDYIYVGQNLIISNAYENSIRGQSLNNKESHTYHIVQTGENLTEISNKYKVKMESLIEINSIRNPDSIKVGQKLILNKNNQVQSKQSLKINTEENKQSLNSEKKAYGPIIIQSKAFEIVNGKKVLNVLNRENKKFILSISCETKELDVRIPGRQWRGSLPAKEEFEKDLIKDLC